uniref:Uncharacterized protein n=1 Tax=Alexandrium monilatum TaxID=311494 RepID=A0A7S4Q4P1_9DINO|mmetsp:Transcript_95344/g.294048  ORF Transcript_95344/g.294048 Transcript_95344/m.294048 type:complete len:300 (-) Transcript_95344:116-1015(-)|eukprot:CAMPEP_0175402432 /NCGR_PEP_ID=MMETSP0095-20121207/37517_1 /TAXON_ID=311494 /ORGANISM="Alexandrium monilatum, Strain CCMP3105" /LENGTH=299 /DNA_ID=CAMNT_0016701205 /DNA_START=59 /DNA_END=958 /DNA_ORIENTATION=+
MIIDTPEGPKFEWEVDEETLAAAIAEMSASQEEAREKMAARKAATEAARAQLEQQAAEKRALSALEKAQARPSIVDPGIVALAERGDVERLAERLQAGCCPDVIAFEFDLYPGGARMFCNDWTPLAAAAAAGHAAVVGLLLEARADPDVVCCASTSSGLYRGWSALDCARTGDAMPCERDPQRDKQPRHPEVERLLLAAGARPASALPEAPRVNTYGYKPGEAPRPNPCLNEQGQPVRPAHLYDAAEEAERQRHPGQPKLGFGTGGSGCPMTSMMPPPKDWHLKAPRERTYTGGSKVYK